MPKDFLADYPQDPGRYDEMLGADGQPRPHWQAMFAQLLEAPAEAMREHVRAIARQVQENGVTYNVYADAQGADRPWDLDALPSILPASEWAFLERAVAQRARLLNLALVDLYGEQRTLKEGLLPAALLHGHAGFLRPCHGTRHIADTMLHTYAVDLARAPDGQWWVLADRTQAPSGAGYALENQLVISRGFPDLFLDLRVQHLASFFATLRDTLAQWAPRDPGSPPLTVLLTPGPVNETYFEHAYLARYLGFPLVEGHDLTVREGKVWLKTLSGLVRVHAILRRQDDDWCDPLELRGDSSIGVPGLVDAERRGSVLIANALGSNVLETGMLFGFLPRLSEALVGEPLAMPSIATWWCGEPAALEAVLGRLHQVVVKPAFPHLRGEPVFGADLDARGLQGLAATLRDRPGDYVAQEIMNLSQSPVWDRERPRKVLGRATSLRVFACATPNGYVVMPGGLTRVAGLEDARVVSMQRGGGSKDTWVMAAGAVNVFSLLRKTTSAEDLVRAGPSLSSRVVENLYWFGRHEERCDHAARLLRVTIGRLLDDAPRDGTHGRAAMLTLLRKGGVLPATEEALDDLALVRALRSSVTDATHTGLASHLRHLFRLAMHLRERFSLDNWRVLTQVTGSLGRPKSRAMALTDVLEELDQVVTVTTTLSGFALDGMVRDAGWRFLSIGRRIERAQWLCDTLREGIAGPEDSELNWLLDLSDSIVTYRTRYRARPEWMPVLDLLIRDVANPRSLAFQMKGLVDAAVRLGEVFGELDHAALAEAAASIDAIDPVRDLVPGSERLDALLAQWSGATALFSEQLSLRFFSHVGEEGRQTAAM